MLNNLTDVERETAFRVLRQMVWSLQSCADVDGPVAEPI